MERKSILYTRFADLNGFNVEVYFENVTEVVETIKRIGPSFGGINLEDTKDPDFFLIEQRWVRIDRLMRSRLTNRL